MLILLDHCTPAKLRFALRAKGHIVKLTFEQGWSRIVDKHLLGLAEQHGFDLLISADQNIRYQQNLKGRKISIVILSKGNWPIVRLKIDAIIAAVEEACPGSYCEVQI